jgi:hypothetical protein
MFGNEEFMMIFGPNRHKLTQNDENYIVLGFVIFYSSRAIFMVIK